MIYTSIRLLWLHAADAATIECELGNQYLVAIWLSVHGHAGPLGVHQPVQQTLDIDPYPSRSPHL